MTKCEAAAPATDVFADVWSFEDLGDVLAGILSLRIRFQRFNIGLLDMAEYEFTDAYVSGRNVAGRTTGHRRTLEGTVVEAGIAAGDGIVVGGDEEDLLRRFPRFGPVLESGMRSMLAVPLRQDDEVVAALVLASSEPDAFDQEALALVNRVGAAALDHIVTLRRTMV